MNKIAIILTTIERDGLFFKSLRSILDNLQENWMIICGYQGDKEITFSHPQVYIYQLPYNCGISYARNNMIQKAHAFGCNYVLLTADSIMFNDSMKDLDFVIQQMEKEKYDLCGLYLHNRTPWEAKLNLIPGHSFELDFIDRNNYNQLLIPCDIVKNFWIADLQSVGRCGYDNDLIMCEHEDFFWRFKEMGFKVCCTSFLNSLYEKNENCHSAYNKIRSENFRIGQQRLKDKYKIKSWVSYKHIERTK